MQSYSVAAVVQLENRAPSPTPFEKDEEGKRSTSSRLHVQRTCATNAFFF